MKKSLILLTILWFGTSFDIQAQKFRKFAEEPVEYLDQVRDVLRDQNKDAAEQLHLAYSSLFQPGVLDNEEMKAIFDLSNTMLKKRTMDLENWEDLILTLVHVKQFEAEEYQKPFILDLEEYTRRLNSRRIADYLDVLRTSFVDSSMFDDGKLRWWWEDGMTFTFEDGPKFTVEGGNLWGYFKEDSTIIENTSGVFDPKEFIFKGQGGLAYFTRAGLSPDTAYIELSKYSIVTNRPGFEADSVILHSQMYITEPIEGRFEEKLSSRVEESNASFPRFFSYRKDLVVQELLPDVDYKGGYSVVGGKIFASGTDDIPAEFDFKYEGKPLVIVRSPRFYLRKEIFMSDEARVLVKINEDSIYHPASYFKFFVKEGVLSLNRENKGLSMAPYSDTYHDVDMFFEVMSWKLGDPTIQMGNMNMGAVTPVVFESKNYYRGERLAALQGTAEVNPLYNLRNASQTLTREMELKDLAFVLGMDELHTHRFMLEMSIQGFVDYNRNTGHIYIKDKVFDYINNYEEKRDYDVIRFISALGEGANATMSLETFKMEIRGVQGIALSDSQEVAMYPRGRKITMHEGLDFDFDGRITAGRFSFWGQKFFFDYDKFQVNMNEIDSMRFKVLSFETDVEGRRKLVDVKNVLQDINGELLIDKPDNKSGKITYNEYPIFRSGRESFIYYDRPEIFNGVYKRENFFVEIEPFEIDSLDNASTEGLKFGGTFVSAGIFPEMQEDIKVQEDYSLGFKTSTPPEGYPAYGGKGTVVADLNLSNKGLRGNGTLTYLKSTSVSNDFIYFPDSTDGLAQTYELEAQLAAVEYPHVTGTDVDIHWEPYNDVLYSSSTTTPMAMYDDVGMEARGTLALTPQRLGGEGRLDFLDAQTDSKDYLFKNKKFTSPEMDFRVRANPTAKWGFDVANVNGFVDFTQERGEFKLNDPGGYLTFPINQYAASMNFAEWKIPEKSLEVKKLGSGPASEMVSIHPKQDSLRFNAGSAKFYLERTLLEGFDIPHMDVADARIFPDSGYVAIDSAANMRLLTQATLLANRTTKFHNFTNASLKVKGRQYYYGSGDYDYVDLDGTTWPLHFDEIKVDTGGRTIGTAIVKQEDNFYLSPFFAYYGKALLEAPEQHLMYDGFTLIQQTCDNIETTWFKFKTRLNPKRIIIDLPEDNPDTRADNLYNGIYISPDSTSGYSAFLSRESSKADMEIFSATGVVYYDEALFSYVITTRQRAEDPNKPGNLLLLNNKDCITTGEGGLSFGADLGRISMGTFGTVTHELNNDQIEAEMAMLIDFFFNEDILKAMAEAINARTSLGGSDLNNTGFRTLSERTLSERDYRSFWEEVSKTGAPEKMPKELSGVFTFSDVKMVFDPEYNSFVSEGPIGLASILRIPVNKQVEGIIEIQRKRRGDEITIYLNVPGGEYYYFEYKRNVLQFYSSDKAIMEIMQGLEMKDRSLDRDGKLPPFTFNQSSRGKVNRFLSKFE